MELAKNTKRRWFVSTGGDKKKGERRHSSVVRFFLDRERREKQMWRPCRRDAAPREAQTIETKTMLGVSQQSNPPSSLRHSASFSCLQRSSNGETGHRARTSTLPQQQQNVQLSSISHHHHHHHHHHHYGGPSSFQQHTTRGLDSDAGSTVPNNSENTNDYGFVRIRPRLRSANSAVLREGSENRSWQQKSSYSDRENSSSSFGGLESSTKSKQESATASCDLEASNHRVNSDSRESREISKNSHQTNNPLRGALILFTASTSSWWKAKQREEFGASSSIASSSCSSGTTERKWSNGVPTGTAMTPPSSSSNGLGTDRKWTSHQQQNGNPSLSERKWSSKAGTIVGNNSGNKDEKWTSVNASSVSPASSTVQDRKWRSLGALLRTPVTNCAVTAAGTGSNPQHPSSNRIAEGNGSLAQNMSVSMIENGFSFGAADGSRESWTLGATWKSLRYPASAQPTSYSAGKASWTGKDEALRENGQFARPARSGKVSRKLYLDSADESPECRVETWNGEEHRIVTKTRGESSGDEIGWKKKSSSGSRDSCQRSDRQGGDSGSGSGIRQVIQSTRSNRAQSFYLLDDFLRPQQQQQQQQQPQSSSKCSLDIRLPSQYSRNGNGTTNDRNSARLSDKHQQQNSAMACNGQQQRNNLSNITPPRRHNSSSDSLEVATSPLPPPVPPPPPPEMANREKDRGAASSGDHQNQNTYRDKDVAGATGTSVANSAGSINATSASSCRCRMCWASLQQRSSRDEVSSVSLLYLIYHIAPREIFSSSSLIPQMHNRCALTRSRGRERQLSSSMKIIEIFISKPDENNNVFIFCRNPTILRLWWISLLQWGFRVKSGVS